MHRNIYVKHMLIFVALLSWLTYFFFYPANAVETLTIKPTAYVWVSNSSSEPKSVGELRVGRLYGIAWISYVKYDLSTIPPGATIESASLKLKSETFIEGNRWVVVRNTSVDWTEDSITWDNRPQADKYVGAEWIELFNEWYYWDCTYIVNNNRDSVAFVLDLLSGTDGLVTFSSTELEITYIPDADPPTITELTIDPSSPTPDDQVIVRAKITDGKAGVKESNLYYLISNYENWIKVTMTFKESKYQATIPAQSENTTVQYYIEAVDNAGNRKQTTTYSYIVRSKPELPATPLLVLLIIIGAFIVFGLPIIGGVLVFKYLRKRRSPKVDLHLWRQ